MLVQCAGALEQKEVICVRKALDQGEKDPISDMRVKSVTHEGEISDT